MTMANTKGADLMLLWRPTVHKRNGRSEGESASQRTGDMFAY